MSSLAVNSFVFSFEPGVSAQKYDTWQHYTKMWQPATGQKAMDVVAIEESFPPPVMWLIEAKDFRIITNPPNPCNVADLPQTVADKAIDTLAGLADAANNATDKTEQVHATKAQLASTRRIVLHLEPHTGQHSALFPTAFAANVLQKLKQLVKLIDPNPLVLNIKNTPVSGVPWSVT